MQRTIKLSQIGPNPFRNLERYKLLPEKVEALENSMRETGLWANIVVREQNGHYELGPGGHHRHVAASNVFGADALVDVDVRDLDNDTMMRMLAEENLREWDADFSVEVETIRAVLAAAEDGEISLRPHDPTKAGKPARNITASGNIPDAAIAEWLGGNWSQQRVNRCTSALRDLGDDVDELEGVSPTMAVEIIRTAKAVAAAKSPAPSQAAVAKQARKLAIEVRGERLHRDELREMAGIKSGRGSSFHRSKRLSPTEGALKLQHSIGNFLNRDQISKALDELLANTDQFEVWSLDQLALSLDGAAKRARRYADALRKEGSRGEASAVPPDRRSDHRIARTG